MEGVIVAYQPNNCPAVFLKVREIDTKYGSNRRQLFSHSIDGFPDVDTRRNIVAIWTIKPKGGMPKLDAPILSEEDVKYLND